MQSQLPKLPSGAEPARMKPGRGILAVSVGTIVDLAGTNLAFSIITIVVMFQKAFQLASQGLSQTQIQVRLVGDLAAVRTSAIVIAFGVLFSLLGGYVAGRIAKRDEILYGMASGLGVIAVSVVCTFALRLPTGSGPLWQVALQGILNVGINTFGGFLARLQRTRTPWAKLHSSMA